MTFVGFVFVIFLRSKMFREKTKLNPLVALLVLL